MKILYLAPERTVSNRITGMTFIDEELESIVARGIEAHVLSVSATEDEVIRGVHIRAVPGGRGSAILLKNLRFFLQNAPREVRLLGMRHLEEMHWVARIERFATELLRAEKFDLIHSHFGYPFGVGGAAASKAAAVPLVCSFRGMDLLMSPELAYGQRLNPFFDAAVRSLVRIADRTLYNSDHLRSIGIELGAPTVRAETIRKGVRTDLFTPGSPAGKASPPQILTVCGLLPRKRVDHLLRAAALIAPQVDFRLVVCGTGPEESSLKELARSLGLAERTEFTGWIERNRIPDLFRRATVFVLASVEEAAGNVLLEAQASGTPAICMRSAGAPEYVLDGETGFCLEPEDVEALAAKVLVLLTDGSIAQKMGLAARDFAAKTLGYEAMIDSFIHVYEQLLPASVTTSALAS